MVPDDATPLFRLAWYVNPNAQEIENRLQMKRPVVEGQFVNFLLTQGDPDSGDGGSLAPAANQAIRRAPRPCWEHATGSSHTSVPIWP